MRSNNEKNSVVWTNSAQVDVKIIVGYIAEESPKNARSVKALLFERAQSLSENAKRGRLVPELQEEQGVVLRELIVSSWRLMYRIERETVYVLAVVACRQDWDDALLNRMMHHS